MSKTKPWGSGELVSWYDEYQNWLAWAEAGDPTLKELFQKVTRMEMVALYELCDRVLESSNKKEVRDE